MDDRYVEVEPYEEIVDRAEVYSTPSGSRSASPVSVDRSLPPAQSLSQGLSTFVYNANLMTSVMRPDQRYELALASQVPHTQTEHPDTSAVALAVTTYQRLQPQIDAVRKHYDYAQCVSFKLHSVTKRLTVPQLNKVHEDVQHTHARVLFLSPA